MNFLSILSRFYILALQLDLKSMFSNGAGSESLLVRYLWLVYVLCAYHWFILQRERAAIFLTTNYITIALYIEDQVQRVLTEIYLKKFEIKMGTKLEKLFIFRTQLVWSGLLDFRWFLFIYFVLDFRLIFARFSLDEISCVAFVCLRVIWFPCVSAHSSTYVFWYF